MANGDDVLIVGAGVIGCSIAFHLAKHGIRARLIEREAIAARASGKSWAVFAYPPRFVGMEGQPGDRLFSMPIGSVRPWLELLWLGYHRLPDTAIELRETTGIDIGYGELSWVRLALTDEQEAASHAALAVQRDQGYHEGVWLAGRELRQLFPALHPDVRGGLAFPYLQIEPYPYTLALAQAAEKRGAAIRHGELIGFRTSGSRATAAVLASGTELPAGVFVLATGPWTGGSTAHLGKPLPVLLNREQCLRLAVPNRLPPFGLTAPDGLTIVPKVSGDVILGHAGRADLQTDFDVSLTTEDMKMRLMQEAVALLPALEDASVVEQRGDLEGWSPPPLRIRPVLGRLPGWDNVYVAARFGTLGMMMSLGAGRMLADVIAGDGAVPARFRHAMEVLTPE